MQPGSQLSINAVEGFPLDDFNSDVNVHKSLEMRMTSLQTPIIGRPIPNYGGTKDCQWQWERARHC